jgi:tetratricopeptide (TPR) repeat protein
VDTAHDRPGTELLVDVQTLADSGDFAGAVALCRERLATVSGDVGAHRCLAELYAAGGEMPLALHHAHRACELQPEQPVGWSALGRVQAQCGKLAEAVRCFTQAVQLDSRYADGWHNLGVALEKAHARQDAFAALKRALSFDPTRAETYLVLGNLLIEVGQFEDAVECFDRAGRHDPRLASARSRLAEVLSQGGKVGQAESLFRQSLGLDPDHLQGWLGLGRALEDLGQAEGARAAYLNVLRRQPGHAVALGQYLALLREGDSDDAAASEAAHWLERATTALRDDAVNDEARALIGYGLAKYHARRADHARSAEAGLAANAARRRVIGPLDRGKLSARVDGLISTYGTGFFASRKHYGLGTDQPVFIVGLPRSGTTLTEQILSAHPLLRGAGELPDLVRIASRSMANEKDEIWRAAERLEPMKGLECGHEYLRALRDGARRGTLRIIDKSPFNFYQLAFAALLFPNARVIHCRRDARDNALSIWLENFNAEQRYATDFGDLAFLHAQYQRLMAHWRKVLPLKLLEVCYEDTVADHEGQARRMLEFLDVPWDARCLSFHNNERAVQTPSRWQVRQPVYSRSIGRWRDYAEYLPQMVAAFASGTPGA